MSCDVQQCEATEALRAALGRTEAALMARERKLADSWKVLRVHADSLRSGTPVLNESGLAVSSNIMIFASSTCCQPPGRLHQGTHHAASVCTMDATAHASMSTFSGVLKGSRHYVLMNTPPATTGGCSGGRARLGHLERGRPGAAAGPGLLILCQRSGAGAGLSAQRAGRQGDGAAALGCGSGVRVRPPVI